MQTNQAAAQSGEQSTVVFTWHGFLRGLTTSVSPLVGAVPFAIVTGVTAQAHALSLAESTFMSAWVFAASAQMVVLASWTIPASIAAAALTSFAVCCRFALMGPSLGPWLDHLRGWRRWVGLFFIVELTWAYSLKEIKNGNRDAAFLAGSGVLVFIVHVGGTVLGFLLGSAIAPVAGHPIYFAALAAFIALLVPMWRGRTDFVPWVVAAAVALALHRCFPATSWHIVCGAFAGASCGLVADQRRASR